MTREPTHTYAFSALFKPLSIKADKENNNHKKFMFNQQILELFEAIDGSKQDDNLLGFLDYDKIKKGNMCRHIVCVLPYRASCDALENLISSNVKSFRNLQDYLIINISGVDNPKKYSTVQSVKYKIKQCEAAGQKTITLTVNRMLTGSTVEEWDTMLYFKDTASPQEYDQAIFRLQNQYIREYTDKNHNVIKFNMKPQTLLVDFDPHRMFFMQEQKSLVMNITSERRGNNQLRQSIVEELKFSPIITINNKELKRLEAADLLLKISEYSKKRSIIEETFDIPIDFSLLSDDTIRREIYKQAEIGSKAGLKTKAVKGEEIELDTSPEEVVGIYEHDEAKNESLKDNQNLSDGLKDQIKLQNKFRTYYSRILMYAFLSKSRLTSLSDILADIDNELNHRIAKNLDLDKHILLLVLDKMNPSKLNKLDYKIQNISKLAHDDSIEPIDRAMTAIRKFPRLSEYEVTTPANVCNSMIDMLPDECFLNLKKKNHAILDLGSKAGEFAIAIYRRCLSLGIAPSEIKTAVVSIPSSPIAYEFTSWIYEVLGFRAESVAKHFTSNDLIKMKNAGSGRTRENDVDYKKISTLLTQDKPFAHICLNNEICRNEGDKMKFDAVVGNPPYQKEGGSGGTNAAPIYQDFALIAEELKPSYISLLIPSRWFTGGRDNLLADFRSKMLINSNISKMYAFVDSRDAFPNNVDIKGGVCYYLYDEKHSGLCEFTLDKGKDDKICESRNLGEFGEFDVFIRDSVLANIVRRIMINKPDTVESIISSDTPFGIPSNPKDSKKNPFIVRKNFSKKYSTKLFHIEKSQRKIGYIDRTAVTKNVDKIDLYKVFIPKGYGAGESFPHQILGIPEYAGCNSVCSQSYLYAAFNSEVEAKNFIMYLKTKFFRALVLAMKISQDALSKVYRFVPLQDFSKTWTDEELYDLYSITKDERAYIERIILPMES